MEDMKLGLVESRFADIVWANEPIHSRELVKLCSKELEWKKSTTYTVLKKLCDRGLFQNQDGMVSAVISKEEFHAIQSEKFVKDTFDGSLPQFISAFTSRKALTPGEILQIRRMIDAYEERVNSRDEKKKDSRHEKNMPLS